MKEICIIGVYFGNKPKDFDLWLKSCEANSNVDFLIVADFEIEKNFSNISFLNMKFSNFKNLAKEKISCKNIDYETYKICDLKPMYGFIFEDYLRGYKYWGHCDFDMIFGDVCNFVSKYHYDEYDKFLPLGHLSLYRNDGKKRYLEETGSEYDADYIINDNHNYIFDEFGINRIYERYKFFDEIIFADINYNYKKFEEVEKLSYYNKIYDDYKKKCEKINYKYQVFYYENGKVYKAYIKNKKVELKEYMYIHMQKRKKLMYDFNLEEVSRFYILDGKLIQKKCEGIPSKEEIKEMTPCYWFRFFEIVKMFSFKVYRYFNKKILKKSLNNIIIPRMN